MYPLDFHIYQTNLDILANDEAKAERTLAATVELISMIAPDPDLNFSEGDIARTFLDCLTNAKFIPTLGVTNSLVASGDIGLISDPEIQRAGVKIKVIGQRENLSAEMIEEIERTEELTKDNDKFLASFEVRR